MADKISPDMSNYVLTSENVKQLLRDIRHIGSRDKIVFNRMYGFEYDKRRSVLMDADEEPMIYFTRPDLNTFYHNLALSTDLMEFAQSGNESIKTYVRALLGPSIWGGNNGEAAKSKYDKKVQPVMLDQENPFMTIMTNNLLSLTGWPDTNIPIHTSPAGVMKESHSIYDGQHEINESLVLNATFSAQNGDVIYQILRLWLTYGSLVFRGNIMPLMGNLWRDEKDYTTRIYVVILDKGTWDVKRIAYVGGAIPINNQDGKFFDYTGGNNFGKDLQISFQCDGVRYNSLKAMSLFNEHYVPFNPAVKKLIRGESGHGLVQLPSDLIPVAFSRSYHVINLKTGKMEFYIPERYIKEEKIEIGDTEWN